MLRRFRAASRVIIGFTNSFFEAGAARYLDAVPRDVLRGQHTLDRCEVRLRGEVLLRQVKAIHPVLHRVFLAGKRRRSVSGEQRSWLRVDRYHLISHTQLLIRRHLDLEFHVTSTRYRRCEYNNRPMDDWILPVLNFAVHVRRRKQLAIHCIYARRIIEILRKLIECTSWCDLQFVCTLVINVCNTAISFDCIYIYI